jgi:hypothetical protein
MKPFHSFFVQEAYAKLKLVSDIARAVWGDGKASVDEA